MLCLHPSAIGEERVVITRKDVQDQSCNGDTPERSGNDARIRYRIVDSCVATLRNRGWCPIGDVRERVS